MANEYPAGFWATHVENPVTGEVTNEDGTQYVPTSTQPTHEQIEFALLGATSSESVLGFVRVDNAIRAVEALLSQPKPPYREPGAVATDADWEEVEATNPPAAVPTRIEDMAPGTTFTAETTDGYSNRWTVAKPAVRASGGVLYSPGYIDATTIRNVTIPNPAPKD